MIRVQLFQFCYQESIVYQDFFAAIISLDVNWLNILSLFEKISLLLKSFCLSHLYLNILQLIIFNFCKSNFINDVSKLMRFDFSCEYFLFELRVNLATIFENI